MKKVFFLFLAGILSIAHLSAQVPEALSVKSFTLDNGLTVWINEDPNQTAVYGAVVVKAGAVDCPGTGIAHYFEHIMFKGTDKIGTIDYEAEKPYLDSIALLYDNLAMETDTEAKTAIQKEINRMSIKAADYAIPNEFNNLISEMSGSGLNAFTSYDETVYHNKFLPEYFEQWAELNSERIMNPVFRLFQSELETVYEEKNRSDDNIASDFQKTMLKNIYGGSGYSEQIIGTTENLKNPRLSQMREFFEKYYVASNMGLVLTGNIKAEEVLPVIKRTFGRIRKGDSIERAGINLPPINGKKEVSAMINMPVVKVGAVCFRGPSKRDADFLGASFLTFLLNNDAGTGLLDKLMVNHKLMMAMAMPDLSFKNAGSIMVLYMPKLIVQSSRKATRLIFDTFDTLKKGDFSDEYFESCKMTFKKQLISSMENQSERTREMAFAFSDELDWDEVVSRPEKLDGMTKEDIVALANKYLGDNYVLISKKKGVSAKDDLKKPDYEKVVPKNREASSAYAQKLRATAEHINVTPKAIDYEKDAQIVEISPLVRLYATDNPYNDIFQCTLSFGIGTREVPALERVETYVNLLGTSGKTFEEIHSELQRMGSSIGISSGTNSFKISLSGFDRNFDETLAIASQFLTDIKGDRKKLNRCKTEEKASTIIMRSSIDDLDNALFQKVRIGEHSEYLNDRGEYTDEALLGLYKELQKVECDILYSGTLPADKVAGAISSHIDVNSVTVPSKSPIDFDPIEYDGPQVFFVDKKDATQSLINLMVVSDKLDNMRDRYCANLYSSYLGGGMSSLLFQEIREFRSMAYATSAFQNRPDFINRDKVPVVFTSYVGTQSDKTLDAMAIMDSLMMETPFLQKKIDIIKKEFINKHCNEFPDFRQMPMTVAWNLRNGFTESPVDTLMQVARDASPETMEKFWREHIAGRNTVWAIVGSSKKLDLTAFEKYGQVTTCRASDIIR